METASISIVGDRYELLRPLGDGGMGEVHLAHDRVLARPVAVKVIYPHGKPSERAQMAERFLREAQLAASVRHRNVVQTLDFGTTEHGDPFMVMEVLEGETLGDRLDRGPISVTELVHVARLVMRGLSAVHAAGIVHRDLKPDNVFLVEDADGVFPKLLDFGISRSMESGRSAVTTREGRLVGTPHYMSPEQARGITDVDWRTDIYAMGVILYEALSGELPYESEHVGDLIVQIVTGEHTPLASLRPELDAELCGIVEKAMASDAADRYLDAREMFQALNVYAERSSRAAPLSTVPRRRSLPTAARSLPPAGDPARSGVRLSTRPPPSTRPRRWWMGAALVLLPAATAALLTVTLRDDPEPAAERETPGVPIASAATESASAQRDGPRSAEPPSEQAVSAASAAPTPEPDAESDSTARRAPTEATVDAPAPRRRRARRAPRRARANDDAPALLRELDY